jgi:hypothetical protein
MLPLLSPSQISLDPIKALEAMRRAIEAYLVLATIVGRIHTSAHALREKHRRFEITCAQFELPQAFCGS